MASRTLVAILAPGEGTSELCVGTGLLVNERAVLVHPPLSRRLHARTAPAPTRVAVCSFDPPVTEFHEVAEVQVAGELLADPAGGAPEPVVGLALAGSSPAVDGGGFADDEGLLFHLRDPYGPPPPLPFTLPTLADDGPTGSTPAPHPSPAPHPTIPAEPPGDFRPPDPPFPPPILSSNVLCRFLGIFCR